MGVDIGSLFHMEEITLQDMHHQVIAIDAYNVLHQFLSSIRQRDGTLLKDAHGNITSHLLGLLHRTATMMEYHIRPIYIFDGVPHPLKQKTLELRKHRKLAAEKEWREALEKGDLDTARSKAQQTSRVTHDIVDQSKELLTLLGIPYIQAPSEGEAQASYLVKQGDAQAVGSQDFDCLLVGTPVLIRNLTSNSRRKLPGKKAYSSIHPERILLHADLKKLEITQEQLVDIALLIGTDFNEGIKGIGPMKGLQLIKKHGAIEQVLSTLGDEHVLSSEEIHELRNIFLQPNVSNEYDIVWLRPDIPAVLDLLCKTHQFTEERVKPILEKFVHATDMVKQRTLF